MLRNYIFLAAILIATPSMAQTSFMGVSLNGNFPGKMQKCPKSNFGLLDHEALKNTGICYFQDFQNTSNTYQIWNGPNLGIGHTLSIETYKNKPLIFKIDFGKDKFSQVADIFISKYGKPQKQETVKKYTQSGSVFNVRTYQWNSGNLHIELEEIGSNILWGSGTILNLPLAQELDLEKKSKALDAANKL